MGEQTGLDEEGASGLLGMGRAVESRAGPNIKDRKQRVQILDVYMDQG